MARTHSLGDSLGDRSADDAAGLADVEMVLRRAAAAHGLSVARRVVARRAVVAAAAITLKVPVRGP